MSKFFKEYWNIFENNSRFFLQKSQNGSTASDRHWLPYFKPDCTASRSGRYPCSPPRSRPNPQRRFLYRNCGRTCWWDYHDLCNAKHKWVAPQAYFVEEDGHWIFLHCSYRSVNNGWIHSAASAWYSICKSSLRLCNYDGCFLYKPQNHSPIGTPSGWFVTEKKLWTF